MKGVNKTHGDTVNYRRSRLHTTWTNMLSRCTNPQASRYVNYGGKGIKVCQAWLSYTVFKEWAMSNGYEEHLTIDRKDRNKDYEPSNCRWITHSENSRSHCKKLISNEGIVYENSEEVAKIFGFHPAYVRICARSGKKFAGRTFSYYTPCSD